MTDKQQMRFGVFVQAPGHHVGGWRHPDAVTTGWPNLGLMQQIAATAERAKFDMFFLGDGFATGYGERGLPEKYRGQAILHDSETKTNYAASDPRSDGAAIPEPVRV